MVKVKYRNALTGRYDTDYSEYARQTIIMALDEIIDLEAGLGVQLPQLNKIMVGNLEHPITQFYFEGGLVLYSNQSANNLHLQNRDIIMEWEKSRL